MKTPLLSTVALLAACSSAPSWNGEVTTYGTLREVLGKGETQGRVVIEQAANSPGAVGLGALEGLAGEVFVFEGAAYVGRVDGDTVVSMRAQPRDEAAFLAIADVPEWQELHTPRELTWAQLESFLRGLSEQSWLGKQDAFPFVVDGEFVNLKSHVIAGSCPIAHPEGPPPARQAAPKAIGRLVGFYSKLPPGTLTHHGSNLHVHVLLAGKKPLVAHVDDLTITAGSRLLVPKP